MNDVWRKRVAPVNQICAYLHCSCVHWHWLINLGTTSMVLPPCLKHHFFFFCCCYCCFPSLLTPLGIRAVKWYCILTYIGGCNFFDEQISSRLKNFFYLSSLPYIYSQMDENLRSLSLLSKVDCTNGWGSTSTANGGNDKLTCLAWSDHSMQFTRQDGYAWWLCCYNHYDGQKWSKKMVREEHSSVLTPSFK